MSAAAPWKCTVEGESCWRLRTAGRVAMLVDGAEYFGALRASLLEARRSVFIVGWDVDSRTPIRGAEPPRDGAPLELGPLLAHLAEHRPKLRIHVLLWDYSLLYALEREPLPRLALDWSTPNGVKVRLDSQLPIGASHHQKLVVVDDTLAYCGGMDLALGRWDDSGHRPGDERRVDAAGDAYGPTHDVQLLVEGEAAVELSRVARARWSAAGGGRAPRLRLGGDAWPAHVAPDIEDVPVGIARTLPPTRRHGPVREIAALYARAIGTAERFVYIENQYATATEVADALARRLRERPALEALVVLPRNPGGWLERQTMGVRQRQFLRRLEGEDFAQRVHVVYPWVRSDEAREPVLVHSKVLVVDDELFTAGSANLTRRSMSTDSECNLAIEARTGGVRRSLARLRRRLMGEHLGLDPETLAERERSGESPLQIARAERAGAQRGVSALPRPGGTEDEEAAAALADLGDPETPLNPLEFVGDMFGADEFRPYSRRLTKLIAVVTLVAAVAGIWQFTPMARWTDPEAIGPLLSTVQASPWAVPAVLAMFILGTLVVFPVTALIAATAIALGPMSGMLWASVGSLAAALLSYLVGQRIGRRPLERLFGQWIGRLDRRLGQSGIASVFVMRTLPVAPFTVVNVLAGASSIRFRDFLLGTILGMGPGIAAITLLSDRLRALWEDPTPGRFGLLVAAIGVWLGVVYGLHVLSRRLARR